MPALSVSVLIPCYNSEATIMKTLASVRAGTRLPDEIIVYDDKSSDGSLALLQEAAKDMPNLVIMEGQENQGAGVARRKMLARASGDYIAFLDSDDWWYREKLEKQMAIAETQGADIVTCSYDLFNEAGKKIGRRRAARRINRFTMHLSNWLPTSMTVVRASLIGAREMPDIRRRQDYAYWLMIFKLNGQLNCVALQESLGGYLRRRDSLSSSKAQNLKFNYAVFREILKYSAVTSAFWLTMNIVGRMLRK